MKIDDPAIIDFIRRSMVVRIATLSRNNRPSINPLYFVYHNGHIWLGTVDWTLAARNAAANPRVSLLFTQERNPQDKRILRVKGRAVVTTDAAIQRAYVLRVAFKYSLSPGGLRDSLLNLDKGRLLRRYHQQNAAKGKACVIDVTPEEAEFLDLPQPY